MKWQVNISFKFIQIALVTFLTYLLNIIRTEPVTSIATCNRRSRNARRRRARRRTNHPGHVNTQGMESLVQMVAAQCPARRAVSTSPAPPAYHQVAPRSRSPSRSPPRTRRSSIFYSD